MIYPLYIPVKRVIQWVSDILQLGLSDKSNMAGNGAFNGKILYNFYGGCSNKACFLFVFRLRWFVWDPKSGIDHRYNNYPLVNIQKAIEHGP